MRSLSQEESRLLDEKLMGPEYGFSLAQLMELAGLSVAESVQHFYPLESHRNAIVFCGPGNNGGDGLVAARHLSGSGYSVTVIVPRIKPVLENLVTQCRVFDVAVENVLPGDDGPYDLIIDALFGFGFVGEPASPYKEIIAWMKNCGKPIVSVDVPSGWPVDGAPPVGHINPEMLKVCSEFFCGRYHVLGGRFVPRHQKTVSGQSHDRSVDYYMLSSALMRLAFCPDDFTVF